MDTIQELEPETIEEMSKVCIVKPVGPLFKIPEATNTTIRGDLMKADDCLDWLSSKPPASVVYISFGSIVYLMQEQVDEIAHGLLSSGVSFLWVMRPPGKAFGIDMHILPDGFLEKIGDNGKLVQWSPQEQVLAHPSLACFLTHCGWNSSVEALTLGVPMVTFPRWGDQVTNAKYLVDVFGVGLRLCRGKAENRLVKRDEVEKCMLEATVGEKAVELKQNALKWKKAAEEAVAECGSSHRNLQDFLDVIGRLSYA
jgi:UDP:flavonoid glycosyltransferase YjiC (YdhE family)